MKRNVAKGRKQLVRLEDIPNIGPAVAADLRQLGITTPDDFLESAISAGTTVLGYCDSRSWWNDDTERLRTALAFRDPERAR